MINSNKTERREKGMGQITENSNYEKRQAGDY